MFAEDWPSAAVLPVAAMPVPDSPLKARSAGTLGRHVALESFVELGAAVVPAKPHQVLERLPAEQDAARGGRLIDGALPLIEPEL